MRLNFIILLYVHLYYTVYFYNVLAEFRVCFLPGPKNFLVSWGL